MRPLMPPMLANLPRTWIKIAGGLTALSLAVVSMQQWQDRIGDREDRTRAEMVRLQALLRQEPAWRDAQARLQELPEYDTALIAGENDSLVAADLQRYVVTRIQSVGSTIRSVQGLPIDRSTEAPRVAVDVEFTVNARQLVNVISDLETGFPVIVLRDMQIRSVPRLGQSGPTHAVDIHVQFRAEAFLEEMT